MFIVEKYVDRNVPLEKEMLINALTGVGASELVIKFFCCIV